MGMLLSMHIKFSLSRMSLTQEWSQPIDDDESISVSKLLPGCQDRLAGRKRFCSHQRRRQTRTQPVSVGSFHKCIKTRQTFIDCCTIITHFPLLTRRHSRVLNRCRDEVQDQFACVLNEELVVTLSYRCFAKATRPENEVAWHHMESFIANQGSEVPFQWLSRKRSPAHTFRLPKKS